MPNRDSWHSSPPLLSPPLLIILLPILAFTLLFFTLPPLLSSATNLLASVKTTSNFNSLNILLVVFAILFGVFARRNEEEQSTNRNANDVVRGQNDAFRNVSVSNEGGESSGYESREWFGFSSNRLQSPVIGTAVTGFRRSSSSYPDLRQMETGDDGYKFRFFDDFEIEKQFRSPARATFSVADHRKRWPEYQTQQQEEQQQQEEEVRVKEIPVDTFEIRTSPVKSHSPPSPPPPPPLPTALSRRDSQHLHQTVESSSEITELEDREFTRIHTPPAELLSATPPRPSAKTRSEKKKSERRKSNVKREIAMVWASVLSNQRKRKKKQRPKNDHNHYYDNVDELTNNTSAPPMTPPPPPPPPPPPSVFHSIFRKGLGKSKKIHSVSAPPPTPPPAPPRRGNYTKPPLPNKSNNFINENLNLNSGNQSPLIPIPPPLPPFKIPAMKFSVRGDFVNIRSNQSSRSASPEREHIDVEVSETTTVTNAAVMNHIGDVDGSVFCPSPDVNVKATTFIARLRGEWRLQKLNSIKEKGNASLPLVRD